jgi:NAD(P)H-hydrate epimerase
VSIATAPEHAAQIAAMRPELMVSAVAAPDELMPMLARADVVAIGPGLGQSAWARALWSCAMSSAKSLVVDADALNLLSAQPENREDWILTPHPGEAGRLLGISTEDVQGDRLAAVRSLHRHFGGTAILKGAGSLIASSDAPMRICLQGNPGMAAPGMGDVLTGIIAGLQGQVRDLPLAARLGVLVHAFAGDRAALRGQRGLIASDVIAELRGCLNPP